MNTNIFDFQNGESSMQFNPLFLPANTFVDNPGTIKSFKISNSSYLFSDIIKVFTGTDLVKDLDLKLNLPSENSSKQVPSENIFSFNISDINNLAGLQKALNNGKISSPGLKEIIALISQLLQAGQNNSLQGGISLVSNNAANDNNLTGDGLKSFLNELNSLFQNADISGNSSKGKNKTDKDTKEIISKILDSLYNGTPVLINIVGKNETLKIELNKTGIEAGANSPGTNDYKSNVNPNELINNQEIQTNELTISAEQAVQNSNTISEEQTEQNLNTISPEKSDKNLNTISTEESGKNLNKISTDKVEQNSKANVQTAGSDKIEELLSEISKKENEVLKNNKIILEGAKIKTGETGTKSISGKPADSLKSFNADENSGKNNLYKLKFEIVDNEKNISRIKNNHNLSNAEDLVNHSSAAAKSQSDSLTIENLVASKSSLKNINKLSNQAGNTAVKTYIKNIPNGKIEFDNTPGKTKISSKSSDSASLSPANDLKTVEGNNKNTESSGELKLIDEKPEQGTDNVKLVKNENQKLTSAEQNSMIKVNTGNPGNMEEIVNSSNLTTEASKEIKVPGSESQSANHKEIDSKSESTVNLKVDNAGKINPNNFSEDNLGGSLSNNKQDLLNNSKGQDQIPNDKGEGAFSSYLSKIDANNIQNVKSPAYLNNMADQMKTIDSAEIVKEISKLASDKDQKNIVLKLVPETLGKVKISLDISNNVIHAHAEVENETAKSLMQNNLENLKQSLAQQGIQLNSLNISLSNHQEQKPNRSYLSKKKFTYAEPQIGEIDEKEHTTVSKHYGYNTYEFLA
ncbi:MAG: flagellar hook-length control protein FliK [Ignavibacteriaceae bacterium]